MAVKKGFGVLENRGKGKKMKPREKGPLERAFPFAFKDDSKKSKKNTKKEGYWRGKPESKPKQKKESFWDRQKGELEESKKRGTREDSPWGMRDEPESKSNQKKESFLDRQRRDRAAERREKRRQRRAKANERRQFFKEMKHEGYKITPLGRKMESDNYRKTKTASEYKAANMRYFSGNRNEEGKYWIKTRKSRPQGTGTAVVEDKPVVEDKVEPQSIGKSTYQFTKEEEREKYLKEMAHEGYELTPAGKAEMKRAFVESNNPEEFRRIVYAFIKYGDKYVVKTSKKGSANMEMAAEHCSRDSGTKAGDWFARY